MKECPGYDVFFFQNLRPHHDSGPPNLRYSPIPNRRVVLD